MSMSADSRRGALPLAEALIKWSDAELVEAIRRAEAAVPEATLRRHGRWTLEELVTLRRPPQRYRMPAVGNEAVEALDHAWDRLFGAFRLAVERGDVVLEGLAAISFGPRERKRLEPERAAEFLFDPPAGAAFAGLDTYVGVSAFKPTPARAGVVESRNLSSPVEVLPLLDAVRAWADPAGIAEYKRMEWLFRQTNRFSLLPTPSIRDDDDAEPLLGGFEPYQRQVTSIALRLAWSSVEHDFRARIERGELLPEGVQTYPMAQADRAPIPHLWAVDFQFEFAAGRLKVVRNNTITHVYVAVRVVRAAPPTAAVPAIDRVEQAASTDARGMALEETAAASLEQVDYERLAAPLENGHPATAASAERARSRGGRKSAMPQVEEALREHWAELFPSGPPEVPPVWADLARRLNRRLRPKGASPSVVKSPDEETIRKHLPKIYARLLGETAAER